MVPTPLARDAGQDAPTATPATSPWSRNWSPAQHHFATMDPSVGLDVDSRATHLTHGRRVVRRHHARVVTGACVVLLAVATAATITVSSLRDGGVGATAPVSTNAAAAAQSVTLGSANPSVAVPDYSAKVAQTGRGTTATSAIGLNAVRSRGVYFVVAVTVTNNSDSTARLVYDKQRLNAYGRTFFADRTATSYLNLSPSMRIAPTGHPVGVKLAFDIPAGWRPDSVTLFPDESSSARVDLPLR